MAGHSETIYNILPPTFQQMPKQARYRSTFSGTQAASASTFHTKASHSCLPGVSNLAGDSLDKVVADQAHANFGRPRGSYINFPDKFQKNMSKSHSVPSLAEVKRANPAQLKPSTLKETSHMVTIPKASDKPVMNLVTSKNFIVANAVETILAAPKKVTAGAKDYLAKEDYGKVPKYLKAVKGDIDAEYNYIRQMREQELQMSMPQHRPLDEEERVSMVNGLKAKWEKINTDYQGGTHITKLDTKGKMRRRECHEAELSSIEKDIEKLSKRNIHVHGDE